MEGRVQLRKTLTIRTDPLVGHNGEEEEARGWHLTECHWSLEFAVD